MRFGPWNIRNLYWSGSLPAVVREISRYTRKSDLVSVQEVKRDKGGSASAGNYIWGTGEMYARFWWGNLKKREHLENTGVDGRIILRWIFGKWDGEHGLIWLKVGTGSRKV
jgi:hypothetical protein